MRVLLAACDLLLLLGATLRTVRLIVADDLPGAWWIKDPLHRWLNQPQVPVAHRTVRDPSHPSGFGSQPIYSRWDRARWAKYAEGLSCPFCIGLWIAAGMVLILALLGGPGHAPDWWRIVAGILSLNWVAAHLGVRAGDTDD